MYAVYQPLKGVQLTVVRDLLATPHRQHFGDLDALSFTDAVSMEKILPKYGGFPTDKDDFSYVESRVLYNEMVAIPWLECYNYVIANAPKECSSNGAICQRQYVDLGFASGHSFCCKGSDQGIPSPSLLIATKDKFISNLMATVSQQLGDIVPGLWSNMLDD